MIYHVLSHAQFFPSPWHLVGFQIIFTQYLKTSRGVGFILGLEDG